MDTSNLPIGTSEPRFRQEQAQQGTPIPFAAERAMAMKPPPIGVPFRKRKHTRYEIHRRSDGVSPATWEQLAVVTAPSAQAALRDYALDQRKLGPSDDLAVTLRAIPVSRITQRRVTVEQRSRLTFS